MQNCRLIWLLMRTILWIVALGHPKIEAGCLSKARRQDTCPDNEDGNKNIFSKKAALNCQ